MSFTMLVLSALILAAVVLVVRAFGPGTQGRAAPDPGALPTERAENVLADRFARGDIDDEEYQRRLAVLRANASGPRPR